MYFFFAFASIFAQSTFWPSGFGASAFGASAFGAGASAAMLLAAAPSRPAIPRLTMRIFFMTLLWVGCGLRMIQDCPRYKFFPWNRPSGTKDWLDTNARPMDTGGAQFGVFLKTE